MKIIEALAIADRLANGELPDAKAVQESCSVLAKAYRAVTIGPDDRGLDHPKLSPVRRPSFN